jgi:chemotaxis signal transduction protein
MQDGAILDSEFRVLQFTLQNVYLCIDLSCVEKVLPLPMLDPIPASHPYLAGLMNYSGLSIPIINLAWRLGLNCSKPYTLEMPVILCQDEHHHAGLIVDELLGIEVVSKDQVQKLFEFNEAQSPFYATVNINSHLTLLLNVGCVLDLSDIELQNQFLTAIKEAGKDAHDARH